MDSSPSQVHGLPRGAQRKPVSVVQWTPDRMVMVFIYSYMATIYSSLFESFLDNCFSAVQCHWVDPIKRPLFYLCFPRKGGLPSSELIIIVYDAPPGSHGIGQWPPKTQMSPIQIPFETSMGSPSKLTQGTRGTGFVKHSFLLRLASCYY